jgi:hypothetical protein
LRGSWVVTLAKVGEAAGLMVGAAMAEPAARRITATAAEDKRRRMKGPKMEKSSGLPDRRRKPTPFVRPRRVKYR